MVETNQAYIGSTNIKHIYAGSDHVKRVYKGSELVYLYGWEATFTPSSEIQAFTIPAGTHKVHIDCVASKGRDGRAIGGKGGRVQCDLSVSSGQTLYIMVGDIPTDGTAQYNASDIRTNNAGVLDTTSLQSRLIVAGGGGCGSDGDRNYFASGGNGGGLTGASGESARNASGGGGGTQSAGGSSYTSSGTTGQYGAFGLGGNGSSLSSGGAGWYGGGGGSTNGHNAQYWHSGGGGGSSYTNENCQNVVHTQGYNDGAGYVTITYVEV